jgi:putative addiction module component (TIGR02574 family)
LKLNRSGFSLKLAMSTTLTQELLELSAAERIQLAEDLWDSVRLKPEQVPFSEAQRAELDRRLSRFPADAPNQAWPVSTWEEVKERLKTP